VSPVDKRRGAAIHEAGHGVVALALGLKVSRMVIGIAGDLTAGEADIEETRTISLVDRIALCAAGGEAQELFDAPTNEICAISDMIKIYDLIGGYNEAVGFAFAKSDSRNRANCSNAIEKQSPVMLAKGERQRVLRCADCGQPDPMHTAETSGWLNGELREKK
jgi:hypothetical protein